METSELPAHKQKNIPTLTLTCTVSLLFWFGRWADWRATKAVSYGTSLHFHATAAQNLNIHPL